MKYIAAGLIALLSVIVGILAYAVCGKAGAKQDMEPEKPDQQENTEQKSPAAVYFHTVGQLNWKQWLLIGLPALLLGVAMLRLYGNTTGVVSILRMFITALALNVAFLIDLKTHRIPNGLVLFMLAAGAVCYFIQFFLNRVDFQNMIISAVVGLISCLVLFYVLSRLTKNGIGMGDVKLLAAQGWLLGLRLTLTSTLLGLLICTVIAAVLLLFKKKKASDSVPFGPFVFAGYMLVLFVC